MCAVEVFLAEAWAGLDAFLVAFGDAAWGSPLLVLLLGGGTFFLLYSRLRPQLHLGHALSVLSGRFDRRDDPGEITHFQALSTALSATIGLGNIAGVAVALSTGGPGALFWMWVSAVVGTGTKFFTCTLAVLYRGRTVSGAATGGPMYYIIHGLGPRFRPLAVAFAVFGLIGCLPLVVSNQLVRVLFETTCVPLGFVRSGSEPYWFAGLGVALAGLTALVIFGGLPRLARVSARLMPAMTIGYVLAVLWIVALHSDRLVSVIALIFEDAFTGRAVAGGSLGTVVITGIRRGAFSNEAGIGTEVLAHGAARTKEPVREGLVAMLGPMIDTLVICSATGFAILLSGVPLDSSGHGVALTLNAFHQALPVLAGIPVGQVVLALACAIFGLTTLFGYSYYGGKCLEFLVGARLGNPYRVYSMVYVASIVFSAVSTLKGMLGLLDGFFALMAWPTMIGALLLAPRVKEAADRYFGLLSQSRIAGTSASGESKRGS